MSYQPKSYRKFLAASITSAVVAAAAVTTGGSVLAAEQQSNFEDLSSSHYAYEQVMQMVNDGIIKGYPDGTFKPSVAITREQAALMIFRGQNLSVPSDIAGVLSVYDDVDETHKYAKEIAAVTKAGVFQGYNGDFSPNAKISREQMASVIVRTFGMKKTGSSINLQDLSSVHPAHLADVEILAENNITVGKKGSGGFYFDPHSDLNRADFGLFLHRSLEFKNAEPPAEEPPAEEPIDGSGGGGSVIEDVDVEKPVVAVDVTAINVTNVVNGATVTLYDAFGNEVTSATANSSGEASFSNVARGNYTVKQTYNGEVSPVSDQVTVNSLVISGSGTDASNLFEVDLSGETLDTLKITGDFVKITGGTVTNLHVSEDVTHVEFENVATAEGGVHEFDGGGGESIVLTGTTDIKGTINIDTLTDIQIRSESVDAKISGVVNVLTSAKTIINAPTTSLVVLDPSANVEVKKDVASLVIEPSASGSNVKLDSATTTTTFVVKAIDVTVTVDDTAVITTPKIFNDATNLSVLDSVGDAHATVTFTVVANTDALRTMLDSAKDLLDNAVVGTKAGEYAQANVDDLQMVYDAALSVADSDASTQPEVDEQETLLGQAMVTFKDSVIQASTLPALENVAVTYTAGLTGTIDVGGLLEGDVVKVYSAETAGTLLAQSSAVGIGQTSVSLTNVDFLPEGGSVWVTVTNYGKAESDPRVEVSYEAIAQYVADGITTVADPTVETENILDVFAADAVPAGYELSVSTSSNEAVIASDGTITLPVTESTVDVVFTVTRLSDQTTATTQSFTITVPEKAIATNNAGATSTIDVRDLVVGDVVKIYDAQTGGNLLGESAPVVAGETAVTVSDLTLNQAGGSAWIAITPDGGVEGSAFEEVYEAEVGYVADSITTVANPTTVTANILDVFPGDAVPTGFTLSVASSSDETVIAADGTITLPSVETLVDVVFTVTRTSDSAVAQTQSFTITVPKATTPTEEAAKYETTATIANTALVGDVLDVLVLKVGETADPAIDVTFTTVGDATDPMDGSVTGTSAYMEIDVNGNVVLKAQNTSGVAATEYVEVQFSDGVTTEALVITVTINSQ